jgi:hypothetical protein
MTDSLHEIDAPAWMLDLFKAIDTLDMSEGSGFKVFADDIVMQFGPKTVHGLAEAKAFFTKLDAPFITKHIVDRVFQYGNAFLMQGSAELRKKGDATGATMTAAPLFNLLWFNDDGKIMRYVVDFPPQAAAASDVF